MNMSCFNVDSCKDNVVVDDTVYEIAESINETFGFVKAGEFIMACMCALFSEDKQPRVTDDPLLNDMIDEYLMERGACGFCARWPHSDKYVSLGDEFMYNGNVHHVDEVVFSSEGTFVRDGDIEYDMSLCTFHEETQSMCMSRKVAGTVY